MSEQPETRLQRAVVATGDRLRAAAGLPDGDEGPFQIEGDPARAVFTGTDLDPEEIRLQAMWAGDQIVRKFAEGHMTLHQLAEASGALWMQGVLTGVLFAQDGES